MRDVEDMFVGKKEQRMIKYYAAIATQVLKKAFRHALYCLHGALHETVTINSRQGLLTMSTRDEGIGALLFRNKQFEYESSVRAIKFMKASGFIPSDNVSMLDVGANIGMIGIGLLLADQVNLVAAIEPEPRNFKLLRKNVDQNGLSQRMACLQIAVGEKASMLDMELAPSNLGDHRIRSTTASDVPERMRESTRSTIQVKSLPLPQVLELPEVCHLGLSQPSFMWIDVQGYEGHVFRGGGGVLESGLPTVSEICPYQILRAGFSLEEYTNIVGKIWSDYWIERRGRFTRYPITVFDRFLDELGTEGHFENIIFTKRPIFTHKSIY